ncbi:MAG: 50S ribosomal protein L6 [Patescibacteria group bacterium]|jgi:large subunit ribosomal protein L6
MSRIGKRPIHVPADVTVTVDGKDLIAKGPKGELRLALPPYAVVEQADSVITVTTSGGGKRAKAFHGLSTRLIANVVTGVSNGYTKSLEINGVGYRAAMQGKTLVLNVGYSHPVNFDVPEGIEITVQKNVITVTGIDKQLVGQVATNIRRVRPPEPYKGKGIRYSDEIVQRKAGKAAKAGA